MTTPRVLERDASRDSAIDTAPSGTADGADLYPAFSPSHTDDDPVGRGKERLHEPGGRGGLREVLRHRTILSMLVRRDVRVKYRYSSVGWAWSYVRPIMHFCVYYFIIGIVLGIERRVENFAVYVFSGLCLVSFFNDTISSGSKSILKNRSIVKKVWLPREIFPIAGLIGAATRFVPTFVILMVGATATGWEPSWLGLGAAMTGVVIVLLYATALGLLLSVLVVYLRELQHALEFTSFLTHWLTPMIKPWTLVASRTAGLGLIGSSILWVYIWNPLCTGIELFHLAFWLPTVDYYFTLSPHLWLRAWIMIGAGIPAVLVCQRIFTKLQVRVAEEL